MFFSCRTRWCGGRSGPWEYCFRGPCKQGGGFSPIGAKRRFVYASAQKVACRNISCSYTVVPRVVEIFSLKKFWARRETGVTWRTFAPGVMLPPSSFSSCRLLTLDTIHATLYIPSYSESKKLNIKCKESKAESERCDASKQANARFASETSTSRGQATVPSRVLFRSSVRSQCTCRWPTSQRVQWPNLCAAPTANRLLGLKRFRSSTGRRWGAIGRAGLSGLPTSCCSSRQAAPSWCFRTEKSWRGK